MTRNPLTRVTRALLGSTVAAALLTLAAPMAGASAPTGVAARIVGSDLEVTGTAAGDVITLRLQPGLQDSLEITVGPTRAPAFRFRRSTFNRILVQAGAGDDHVRIDETNGVFTDTETTTLDGGDDRDELTGGSAAEVLIGAAGSDTVTGRGGADVALLGSDDDVAAWSAGDGNDVVEGQGGVDLMTVSGSASTENVNLSAVGSRVRVFRDADLATLDIAGVARLRFVMGAGADSVTVNDLAGTGLADVEVDLAGDAQADTVTVNGRTTADAVSVAQAQAAGGVDVNGLATTVHVAGAGGPGDQLIVNGNAGDDTVTADPAVGELMYVRLEGGSGLDKAVTNGTQFAEGLDVSAPAGRVRVSDSSGRFYEATTETTIVNGLGGADTLTTGNGLDALTDVQLDGGDGDDTITGGDGGEILVGGAGRDVVRGGPGVDLVFLGSDVDRFEWSPGDGNDVIEGQSGADTVTITGSGAAEDIDISPIGHRIRFSRSVDQVVLDMDGIEDLRFQAVGASDFINVRNLSGTAMTNVTLDLAGVGGGPSGDGGNDFLFVEGTHGNDAIAVSGSSGNVHVAGLPATIDIIRAEFPNDRLQIDTIGGNDTVNTTFLAPNVIQLTII